RQRFVSAAGRFVMPRWLMMPGRLVVAGRTDGLLTEGWLCHRHVGLVVARSRKRSTRQDETQCCRERNNSFHRFLRNFDRNGYAISFYTTASDLQPQRVAKIPKA